MPSPFVKMVVVVVCVCVGGGGGEGVQHADLRIQLQAICFLKLMIGHNKPWFLTATLTLACTCEKQSQKRFLSSQM